MNEIKKLKEFEEGIKKAINSINHTVINPETILLTAKLWNAVEQIRNVRQRLEKLINIEISSK